VFKEFLSLFAEGVDVKEEFEEGTNAIGN